MNQVEPNMDNKSIAVIGLGYVGLPLFCQLSTSFSVVGYDVDNNRINEISRGIDSKKSVDRKQLCSALSNSIVTADIKELSSSNIFIVTVPTPISKNNKPDTRALEDVCLSISTIIRKNSIVIFESTVYPGATEEFCVPILCQSGLRYNEEFYVGYSPERINIGDNEHQLSNVPKIVSGSTNEATQIIASVYQQVLARPVVVASSIKIAEAAKMYENVQRDILIALANEYSDYCNKEGIDIFEVTECAATKWNFANVLPGLVGGHCIGVDPYYLLHRAEELGVGTPLIERGRQINESKATLVVSKVVKFISACSVNDPKVLLLGFAYKSNTGDTRNTKVADVYASLKKEYSVVDCYDPFVDIESVSSEYKISLHENMPDLCLYDFVIRMVNHDAFMNIENVFDIKQFL
jgi:nucleotide sugar dehydrogenase